MTCIWIFISDKHSVNFFWLNQILKLIERVIYSLEFEVLPEFCFMHAITSFWKVRVRMLL